MHATMKEKRLLRTWENCHWGQYEHSLRYEAYIIFSAPLGGYSAHSTDVGGYVEALAI